MVPQEDAVRDPVDQRGGPPVERDGIPASAERQETLMPSRPADQTASTADKFLAFAAGKV
jgi:hypothetical protein